MPIKEGYVYEFIGFSLSSDKTDLMNKLPKALEDETYYIFFSEEVIKYNVEFNTLGGSVVETQTLEHNANLEKPTKPTKEGHKFINWSYDSSGNEVVEFPLQVTKDLTLYAIFEKEVYDVTIKDQDDNVLETLSVLYNEVPNYQYELPVLYGYTYEFLGYSLNKNGSNLLNTLPKALKYETYYLIIKEEKVNFTVSFDSLGGSTVANQTIPYNDYLNEPTKPTKEGYVFVSWVYDTTTNEVVVFPLQVTKNIKLFATWNEELEIKEYLSALLDGFKLNPYSYIPETLRKDNNLVTYNENDFNNFLNVNNINYGFGEQWNMVLNNLDQSEVFFNVLGVIDSLASTSVALFNNYLDSNPADSNNFEFKESIYSVAINYSNDILSYNLSYDANIPIIGNVKAEINIAHNVITLEKEVRISLGGANALKYEIAENSYSFAIKYLGVRRALFAIEKDLNGDVEGHIYEFLEVKGIGTKSFAQFYITDEYLSVVGNKADAMLLFDGVINELYDVSSAKLLGYEVRETLSAITYNTLWFNLTDISNINNIRYEETEEEKLFYLNNSLVNFESKNVGGFNLKSLSRRYDISFRKQYLYTMEDNKIVEKEVLVPMLFVQQEQLDNFPQDIIEKNSYLSNVQVTLPEKDLNKIILDYETLLIIFDENKENITSEDIINYIG